MKVGGRLKGEIQHFSQPGKVLMRNEIKRHVSQIESEWPSPEAPAVHLLLEVGS